MFSSGSLDILLGHLKAIAELKNFYFGIFAALQTMLLN